MALNGMDKPDVNNFSSTASHRLPTVSASIAFRSTQSTSLTGGRVSTGLKLLDTLLLDQPLSWDSESEGLSGGLLRRQITEVFGPPGAGKTALALEACAQALGSGQRVLWIDCGSRLCTLRLRDVLLKYCVTDEQTSSPGGKKPVEEALANFHYFYAASLAHLIALLLFPSSLSQSKTPPFLVIDSLSLLFSQAYRQTGSTSSKRANKAGYDAAQWLTGRPYSIQGDFVSKLNKFAATNDAVVLVINQVALKTRDDRGAILQSSLRSPAWDAGVATRIAIFRDWATAVVRTDSGKSEEEKSIKARFACVLKCSGTSRGTQRMSSTIAPVKIAPFEISSSGLRALSVSDTYDSSPSSNKIPNGTRKRKFENIGGVKEAEEEGAEYGDFDDDDEFGFSFKQPPTLTRDNEDEDEDEDEGDEEDGDNSGEERWRTGVTELECGIDEYEDYNFL